MDAGVPPRPEPEPDPEDNDEVDADESTDRCGCFPACFALPACAVCVCELSHPLFLPDAVACVGVASSFPPAKFHPPGMGSAAMVFGAGCSGEPVCDVCVDVAVEESENSVDHPLREEDSEWKEEAGCEGKGLEDAGCLSTSLKNVRSSNGDEPPSSSSSSSYTRGWPNVEGLTNA